VWFLARKTLQAFGCCHEGQYLGVAFFDEDTWQNSPRRSERFHVRATTVNLYYACGAWDDKTVADKPPHAVTAGTPCFRRIHLSHITAPTLPLTAVSRPTKHLSSWRTRPGMLCSCRAPRIH